MPFEIRIRERENPDNTIFAGQFPDAVTSFTDDGEENFIELIQHEGPVLYRVIKTLIESDTMTMSKFFLQSLQRFPYDPSAKSLYLKGALINDVAKKAMLYTSEKDNNPRLIYIPLIPRTNRDYIKVDDTCYRCKKIKFSNNDIHIIANTVTSSFTDFEINFFDRTIL